MFEKIVAIAMLAFAAMLIWVLCSVHKWNKENNPLSFKQSIKENINKAKNLLRTKRK